MCMNIKKNYDFFSIFSDIKEIHCYGSVHSLTVPIPRGRRGKGREGKLSQPPSCFLTIIFIRIKLSKSEDSAIPTINDHIRGISI